MVEALRAMSLPYALRRQAEDGRLAGILVGVGFGLLLVWVILMYVRHRAARRRAVRLATDGVCLLAAAGTATMFGLATQRLSPNVDRDYLVVMVKVVASLGADWAVIAVLQSFPSHFAQGGICVDKHYVDAGLALPDGSLDRAAVEYLRLRTAVIKKAYTTTPLYIISMGLATISTLLVVASVISGVLAACMKTAELPEPRRQTRRRARARGLRNRNRNREAADAQDQLPSEQAISFFERFVERVPPPTEGVVLGAGRGGTACRICLEVLLEDIGKLQTCGHMFHRRCVIHWLANAEEPCCPLCKAPVRLCVPSDPDQCVVIDTDRLDPVPLHEPDGG